MNNRSFSRQRAASIMATALVCAAAHWMSSAGRAAAQDINLPQGVKIERDISYIPDGDEAQRLDLYLPEKTPERPLPLIVHIHGGGWMGGSKFPCGFVHMVNHGYVVASVEYRFSQKAKFPAQIQDCQATIRYVSKDNPPMLILHGTHDALVPYAQSLELQSALQAKGVDVWLQTLPGAGHGGPAFGKPAVNALTQNFFDKYLKGADGKIELVPEASIAIEAPEPVAK